HLRRDLGVVLHETEMREMRVGREADLSGDAHAFRLGLDARELDALAGRVELNAVKVPVEVEVPPGTPELAVGRELEPDLLLFPDDLLDLAVFDLLELRVLDLALGVLGARLLQRCGAQQAADVIGAEWRFGSLHDTTCPTLLRRARRSHAASPI